MGEGTSRVELGRDRFTERVWEWREEFGGTIIDQFKRLGASCDYEEERFTLDPGYHEAVLRVFVTLYEKGYIYRDHYMVNWDPAPARPSRTWRSRARGHRRPVRDRLSLSDGSGELIVATVRPETMLADTAVAVNPADERYTHLIGKTVTLPLVGARAADHRRRLRQDRLRHRRPEDHPGPRPQRLRDRPPPRA